MNNFTLFSILLSLFACTTLFCSEKEATPQQEYERIVAYGERPISALSQALRELIVDVGDAFYDETFYQKLIEAENSKWTGEYVDTWENGQMKLKATLINGVVDGHVHGWYPNGLESFKAYFDKGKKIGAHFAFYYSDKVVVGDFIREARIIVFDLKGRFQGQQQSFYPNQHLKCIAYYKKGKLDGNLGFYDATKAEEMKYKKGKFISRKERKKNV
jgi:antitoxin component YwqK of YwqJK toxin-antitoxin module